MNVNSEPSRKEILTDPVSVLQQIQPAAAEPVPPALQEYRNLYLQQKATLKELRHQKQMLSRQIGVAKREGKSIDVLKAEMQETSKQFKTINTALAETEAKILSFFEAGKSVEQASDHTRHTTGERHYVMPQEPGEEITVSLLDGEHSDWNKYVASNPAASIYHKAEWRDLIRKSFGHPGLFFYARDAGNNIVGILPLVHLKSRLFGNYLVSMPYFNYGGAIADHPSIEQKLMLAANDYAADRYASHIEYRDTIPREGLAVRSEKVNMILQLPNTADTLWASFAPKLRAQIRRSQKENTKVLSGGLERLDDFYSVFARNMRDLGTPVYGKSFFRNILQSFPKACKIITVSLDTRPVAACFLIGHRTLLEIPWASTIRDVNHLSINMLLYWEVLKFALENQYKQFDFGRSSKGSGTFRFKQQWGAEPQQMYWHYWLQANGTLPALNPNNPKYALAINIWKRLPLYITKLIGPPIVKNLP